MSPRIALVVPVFPVLSETFIVRHWLGLVERGWDAHVVCGRFDEESWRRLTQASPELRKRIHEAPPSSSLRRVAGHLPRLLGGVLRRPAESLAYCRRGHDGPSLRRLKDFYLDAPLIALQPDLIHFELGSLAPMRMGLRERLQAAVVVSFRGFDLAFVGLDEPGFYDPVWQRADRVHFLGRDLKRRAERRGCPPDIAHDLIPPAVDSERFRPAPGSESAGSRQRDHKEGLRILSVGRLVWKKGYELGLRAIRQAVDDGLRCTYTLVGDGPEMGAVAYARRELGLESVVTLLGAQPHERVIDELRRADVFLHPAVSEGFCNAVLEAQAMTLPVVTTDADGLPENVADGETGFVVPRRRPSALAAALLRLGADSTLAHTMGQAGRRRVQEHFRPAQELDGFESCYEKALEEYRRTGPRPAGPRQTGPRQTP